MSSKLRRRFLPFARSFEIAMALEEDPCFFLGVVLPTYAKTVQNSCIRNLARSYVVNIHENTFLSCGS